MVEDDLQWKTTFGGRLLLLEDDPCMLPSPLCGIFKTLPLASNIYKICNLCYDDTGCAALFLAVPVLKLSKLQKFCKV